MGELHLSKSRSLTNTGKLKEQHARISFVGCGKRSNTSIINKFRCIADLDFDEQTAMNAQPDLIVGQGGRRRSQLTGWNEPLVATDTDESVTNAKEAAAAEYHQQEAELRKKLTEFD
jgi:hypothetical protein